jgi:sterol desaturase/sphingolipid hydroxylase (fatty acid hydroxylase superfamily)
MNDVTLIELIPLGAFVLFLGLQTVMPRRSLAKSGMPRILHNSALFIVNSLLLRLLIPLTLLSASAWALGQGVGVFNWLSIPAWLTILICIVLLDLSIYAQHVATHRFPLLWRMHKVHHADSDMDVTTAVRFHPIELILSLGYKSLIVVILGAPIAAVIVF